jgi:hypothetical protein
MVLINFVIILTPRFRNLGYVFLVPVTDFVTNQSAVLNNNLFTRYPKRQHVTAETCGVIMMEQTCTGKLK